METLDELFAVYPPNGDAGRGIEELANCWSLKGYILNSWLRYTDAVDAATNGLKIHQYDVNSLHVRSYANVQLGRYPAAEKDAEDALALTNDPKKRQQLTKLLYTIRQRKDA